MDYPLFPHQQKVLDKLKEDIKEGRHTFLLISPRMTGKATLRRHLDQALKKEPEQSN